MTKLWPYEYHFSSLFIFLGCFILSLPCWLNHKFLGAVLASRSGNFRYVKKIEDAARNHGRVDARQQIGFDSDWVTPS